MSILKACEHSLSLYNKNITYLLVFMLISNRWFTLVELVVVTTIVAILAATGFIAYTSYLKTGNDTNRITQLTDIRWWLQLYSATNKLPLPTNRINITASWTLFAYQWNLNKEIVTNIWYQWGWQDPEYDTYPIYMLTANRKDFQLMTFLSEDPASWTEELTAFPQTYVEDPDYEFLFPKTSWQALGILLDATTLTPLQLMPELNISGSYDMTTGTWDLVAYFSDSESISTTGTGWLSIIPNHSCKRIFDMWKSKGSDTYTINPTGGEKRRVKCDMETDGWGWTRVIYINEGDTTWNAWNTDETVSNSSIDDIFGMKINQFSADINGEDLEYMFKVGGKQTWPIYTDVNYQMWDHDMGATRFDTLTQYKTVNASEYSNCTHPWLYHGSASWNWSISNSSGTSCNWYTNGWGFIILWSSNTAGTLYWLNTYSASSAWDNLEVYIR